MAATIVSANPEVNPTQCPTCDRIYARRSTMLAHIPKCKKKRQAVAPSSPEEVQAEAPSSPEEVQAEAPLNFKRLYENEEDMYAPVHPDAAARARARSLGPTQLEKDWAHDPEECNRLREIRESVEDAFAQFVHDMIILERRLGPDHPVMQRSHRIFDELVITLLTLHIE